MAEIVTMAEEELRKRGKADAAELAAQVVAGSITDQELLSRRPRSPPGGPGTSRRCLLVLPTSSRIWCIN